MHAPALSVPTCDMRLPVFPSEVRCLITLNTQCMQITHCNHSGQHDGVQSPPHLPVLNTCCSLYGLHYKIPTQHFRLPAHWYFCSSRKRWSCPVTCQAGTDERKRYISTHTLPRRHPIPRLDGSGKSLPPQQFKSRTAQPLASCNNTNY